MPRRRDRARLVCSQLRHAPDGLGRLAPRRGRREAGRRRHRGLRALVPALLRRHLRRPRVRLSGRREQREVGKPHGPRRGTEPRGPHRRVRRRGRHGPRVLAVQKLVGKRVGRARVCGRARRDRRARAGRRAERRVRLVARATPVLASSTTPAHGGLCGIARSRATPWAATAARLGRRRGRRPLGPSPRSAPSCRAVACGSALLCLLTALLLVWRDRRKRDDAAPSLLSAGGRAAPRPAQRRAPPAAESKGAGAAAGDGGASVRP